MGWRLWRTVRRLFEVMLPGLACLDSIAAGYYFSALASSASETDEGRPTPEQRAADRLLPLVVQVVGG